MNTGIELKPSDMSDVLDIHVAQKVACFVWGPPGIGKSDIGLDLAKRHNMGFIDIRLSQLEPSDLRGYPYINKDDLGNAVMNFAPPAQLPNGTRPMLIFLDEMNSAPPSIQAASYQLVLDRKIGEYKLPDDCAIIAAGNRTKDNGTTFKMAKPLQNRFMHYNMRPDFKDWQTWAMMNNVHPAVVGFITDFNSKLFEFDPRSQEPAFATPRSWHFVSKVLWDESAMNKKDHIIKSMIAGAIGVGNATEFFEYLKSTQKLPNSYSILKGDVKNLPNGITTNLLYALSTNLTYAVNESYKNYNSGDLSYEDWTRYLENYFKFILDNFEQDEMIIMSVRILMSQLRIRIPHKDVPSWSRFSREKNHLLRES